jgi:hypothetical protein
VIAVGRDTLTLAEASGANTALGASLPSKEAPASLPRLGGAADAKELTAVARNPQARYPHLLSVGGAEDVGLEVGGNARARRLLLV